LDGGSAAWAARLRLRRAVGLPVAADAGYGGASGHQWHYGHVDGRRPGLASLDLCQRVGPVGFIWLCAWWIVDNVEAPLVVLVALGCLDISSVGRG
jgi:hypothetical protein